MRILRAAVITILLSAGLLYVYTAITPIPRARAASQFGPVACQFSAAFTTSASVQIITAPNANSWIYICNFAAGATGASTFSIVEGTGSTCGTNTAAMAGGTTAAAGFGMTASGSPVQFGSGVGTVMRTVKPGDNVCLIVGGTGPMGGTVAYDTTTIQQ